MIYTGLIQHESIWKNVLRLKEQSKMPHALLFHGSTGTGKEGHAVELAALLNCESAGSSGACGICPSCKKIRSFQHGNIKLILPYPRGKIRNSEDPSIRGLTEKDVTNLRFMMEEKGKDPYALVEIDKARTILINSIREIKRDIYMSTVDKGYTVVLIFNAEKLCIPQPTSANALLKVLEEPPERTVFILVTSEIATLIDTIKSRCRQVFFPPIPWENIQQHLKESNVPEDRARIIANIANGDMRLARKLVNDIDDLLTDLKQLIRACYSSSPEAWKKVLERISALKRKGITDLSYFFRTGILYFRDLLVTSQSGEAKELVFEILAEHLKKINTENPHANWHACIDILEDTYENIQRNGFVTLMASTMLIDLHKQINGEVSQPFTIHDWIQV